MKLVDTIRRSGRNLRQAKVRTFLTAAALGVGGFTLTLTLAAASGARAYTNRLINTNFDPSSLVVAKDSSLFHSGGGGSTKPQLYDESLTSRGGGGRDNGFIKELNLNDINKIKSFPGVESVLIDYQISAQYVTRPGEKKYTGALEIYNPAQKPDIVAGQAPNTLSDGSILLPDDYINLLGFSTPQEAIGKTISVQVRQIVGQIESKQFKILGVTTKPATSISFTASNILLSQNDARALYEFVNAGTVNTDRFTTVTARVHDGTNPTNLQTTKNAIEKGGYAAESVKDTEQFLNQIINILQIIILVFGFITLIASFFGVVNTQYISVLERTREIGLMKALGMSRRTVSRLFVIEATWIGFIGALLGSLIALGVGTGLNPWISKKLNFGSEHLLIFSYWQILILIIFLMVVTTVAGLLPARKAAKLDPIDALRTE